MELQLNLTKQESKITLIMVTSKDLHHILLTLPQHLTNYKEMQEELYMLKLKEVLEKYDFK